MSKNNPLDKCLETLLAKWKFPKDVIEKYKSSKILEIFDWQAECLQIQEVLEGKNLIYSAPTSAGKTLVAELLMLKNVFDTKRKAVMIFPFVSLAKEKLKSLQIDGFIGSSSPSGGFSTVDIAICTIEKANSLINRLIDDESVFDIGCIVIDELHMVNDGGRGYLLELILSKIKYLCLKNNSNSKIQLLGMSATLPNLKVLADWLDTSLYQTSFRPIALKEYIKYEDKILDKHSDVVTTIESDPRIENDPDHLTHLVFETISQRLGVLVFCPTKARCETLAENIARTLFNLAKNHAEELAFLDKEKILNCLSELKNTSAGLDSLLAKTVRFGIAFHHAGLTTEEREIVENNFKQGVILVIVCTSTLSNGINFPARRVIIRTPMNFGKPMEVMNYKQMCGRAGRKGIDTEGESIILCGNAKEKQIGHTILNSELKEIEAVFPKADDELKASMKRALLETIVSGIATQKSDIIQYTSCFLTNGNSVGLCEKYLKWLAQNEFISIVQMKEENRDKLLECYKPTQLGYAVVASAMSPDEGLLIFSELQKALQCFVLANELHVIYQITPINICDYWINSASHIDWNLYYSMAQDFSPDFKRVSDLVGVRQSFILKMIKGSSISNCDSKLLKIHLRFYTALILNDLVSEVPFASLLNKYGCQKGFLQTLQQSSSTYAAMVHVFCNRLGWFNLEILVEQFQTRLMFGVQRQLLDLIRIKLLNSHRARLFYNAGYTTVASIATCDLKKLERILRSSLQFVSSKNESDKEQSNNNENVIWYDGKGYSYWEACSEIFQDANDLLKADLENLGVKIDVKGSSSNSTNNINKSSVNKSLFEFNDTFVDSIIQSQPHKQNKSINTDRSVRVDKSVREERPEQTTQILPNPDLPLIEASNKILSQRTHLKNEIDSLKGLVLENTFIDSKNKISIDSPDLKVVKAKQSTLSQKANLLKEINSLEGLMLDSQINDAAESAQETPIQIEDSFHNEENIKIDDSLQNESVKETVGENESFNCKGINQSVSKIHIEDSFQNTVINTTMSPAYPTQTTNQTDSKKPNRTCSNSFWDDQYMLEAVKLFEKNDEAENIQEMPDKKSEEFVVPVEPPVLLPKQNKKMNSTVIIDDENMLAAVELYEKNDTKQNDNQQNTNKPEKLEVGPVAVLTDKKMNSTVVGDDILEMCQMMEKKSNLYSAKKKEATGNVRPSRRRKSSIHFRTLFGSDDESDKENSQLNSSPVVSSEIEATDSKLDFDRAKFVKELEKQVQALNLSVNIIETEAEFSAFLKSIRAKTLLSISFCVEKIRSDLTVNKTDDVFYECTDQRDEGLLKFYGMSVCFDNDKQHRKVNFILFKKNKEFLNFSKTLLEREDVIKVIFFAKQHYKLMSDFFGIQIKLPCYDPVVADWLLNQESSTIFQVKQKYCPSLNLAVGSEMRTNKKCYGCCFHSNLKSREFDCFQTVRQCFTESMIGIYCFDKVKLQLQLQNLWVYFAKIESQIVLIVAQMELNGMGIDIDELVIKKELLVKSKKDIEAKVYSIAKREVNINSSHDVASILFDTLKLKLPPTKEGQNPHKFRNNHSTSKDVLMQLTAQHELPKFIMLWRKISHTLANAIFPLDKEKIFKKTMFRVHSVIDMFTVTGRMLFNDPCLQNIPKDFCLDEIYNNLDSKIDNPEIGSDPNAQYFLTKLEEEVEGQVSHLSSENCISMRSLFIPSEDRVFISADYCQLEFRIVTNLCKDEILVGIFKNTEHDVFVLLASKWLDLPVDQVDEEKRQNVKKILYGIIYGMSPKTLSVVMEISESEAASFIDSFKSTFPGLRKFIFNQIETCRLKGYVETIRKRRRSLPSINSSDYKQKTQAERQAINTIVQGSASDLVKTAMVKIEKTLVKAFGDKPNRGANLVMQLHDELIYEVHRLDVDQVKDIIRDGMENCIEFTVKMKVKIRMGTNWGNLITI